MRRQRERSLAGDVSKKRAARREGIDIGSGHAAVAINAKMISTQCVDGHKDDRWVWRGSAEDGGARKPENSSRPEAGLVSGE